MTQNLLAIYQYLEKENITINKTEFEFQIQSHPDYPSLLSIADTLSFFKIDNGVIPVAISNIELLPDSFVALLKEAKSEPKLYFIEKKGVASFCFHDKKEVEISKTELESRWGGIVLLVEKPVNEEDLKHARNNSSWALSFFNLLLLVLVLTSIEATLSNKLFLVFPIVGLLFSVAALKDLFDAKSELLNSFCNMTASNSCATVVGSNKWKIFEIVNFSDLSMVFFTSQFITLVVFLLSGNASIYFNIQQILLLSAVPVLLLSAYY